MNYIRGGQLIYKNSLDIFAHHTGNLFKESGLSNLENRIQPLLKHEELDDTYNYLIHLKQRLMIIWGIKEAVNVIKEGFRPQWFCSKNDIKETKDTAVIITEICIFIMAGQLCFLNKKLENKKIIKIDKKTYTPKQIVDKYIKFPCLPPFTMENDDGKEATSAVILGLCELIRNACKQINKSKIEVKILEFLEAENVFIDIFIMISDNNKIEVKIENPSVTKINGSESIDRIINIENNILNNILENKVGKEVVKTSLEFGDEKNDLGFYKISGTWEYYYNHLVEYVHTLASDAEKRHE